VLSQGPVTRDFRTLYSTWKKFKCEKCPQNCLAAIAMKSCLRMLIVNNGFEIVAISAYGGNAQKLIIGW
jgi:hypothetical protein